MGLQLITQVNYLDNIYVLISIINC